MARTDGEPNHEFTREELEKALEMRDVKGLPWAEIAPQIGKDISEISLRATVSKFRTGKWQHERQHGRAFRARVEHLVTEKGITDTRVLADHFKVTMDSMRWHLRMLGLDKEERMQIRAEFDRRALAA